MQRVYVTHLSHLTDRYGVEFHVLDYTKFAMATILPSKAHRLTLWMYSIYPP